MHPVCVSVYVDVTSVSRRGYCTMSITPHTISSPGNTIEVYQERCVCAILVYYNNCTHAESNNPYACSPSNWTGVHAKFFTRKTDCKFRCRRFISVNNLNFELINNVFTPFFLIVGLDGCRYQVESGDIGLCLSLETNIYFKLVPWTGLELSNSNLQPVFFLYVYWKRIVSLVQWRRKDTVSVITALTSIRRKERATSNNVCDYISWKLHFLFYISPLSVA